MPLFECSKCGMVDNTALGNFWSQHMEGKPPLCTQCDPDIGNWHGRFSRVTADEYDRQFPNCKVEFRVSREVTRD